MDPTQACSLSTWLSCLKVCGHEVAVELIIGVVLLCEVVNLQHSRRYETPLGVEPKNDTNVAILCSNLVSSSVPDPVLPGSVIIWPQGSGFSPFFIQKNGNF